MASPKPSRIRPTDFLFWLQKNPKSQSKNKARLTPHQATKANLQIRESAFHFVAPIGEIIPDMPYLCEAEVWEAKESDFPHFPSVLRLATKKSVKSSIFRQKTSKFLSSLSFKS